MIEGLLRHCTPRLAAILTRPIRWGVITQQYDQMVKYATALRLGTAESEDPAALHQARAAAPDLPGSDRARPRVGARVSVRQIQAL